MIVWRYTLGGKVKHLMPDPDAKTSACGMTLWSYPWWLDTPETVEWLPECRSCVRRGPR